MKRTAFVCLAVAAAAAALAGCSIETTTKPAEPTPTPAKTIAASPKPTPTAPERHYFGQSQIIRDGSEALRTNPLSITVSERPPASVAPTQWGKGWVYAVVRVRFENVGSKFTKSQVGMWSTLNCKNNAESDMTAEWMGDTQGNTGTLELDPGQSATWRVTFTIRKVAKPISYSYQGPGDHVDTWYLK